MFHSGVVDEPAHTLIRAIPEIDHGCHDHCSEIPGDGPPFVEVGPARRTDVTLVELVFVDHPITRVAPGHGELGSHRRHAVVPFAEMSISPGGEGYARH